MKYLTGLMFAIIALIILKFIPLYFFKFNFDEFLAGWWCGCAFRCGVYYYDNLR